MVKSFLSISLTLPGCYITETFLCSCRTYLDLSRPKMSSSAQASLAPASAVTAAMKSSKHITLSSSAPMEQLLRFVASPSISPSVSSIVRQAVSRHVRLVHPNNLPLAPIDDALASRVSSLEAQVNALAQRVQDARKQGLSSLQTCFSRRLEAACAPASPENKPPVAATPPHQKLVTNAAATHHAVVASVQELEKAANSTRKRAASVREVLRIISDNVDVDDDVSQTIADDWTLTFADLDKNRPRKRRADDSFHAESNGLPASSPVPIAGGRQNVFLPISPHITPRSKMRKKLLRSAGRQIRQPSFSSPLPR